MTSVSEYMRGPGPRRHRAPLSDDAIRAARHLSQLSPGARPAYARAVIANPKTPQNVKRGYAQAAHSLGAW